MFGRYSSLAISYNKFAYFCTRPNSLRRVKIIFISKFILILSFGLFDILLNFVSFLVKKVIYMAKEFIVVSIT